MTTYAAAAALFTLGLAGVALLPNLLRKLLAMNVMQVGVIVFFISQGFKDGASIPIVPVGAAAEAAAFLNPLPHTLMLTAIVVSVSTTGLALALLLRIGRSEGTLNEARLLRRLRRPPEPAAPGNEALPAPGNEALPAPETPETPETPEPR